MPNPGVNELGNFVTQMVESQIINLLYDLKADRHVSYIFTCKHIYSRYL